MKKIVFIICLSVAFTVQALKVKPTFDRVGDLVKAVYYFEDGTTFRQVF